MSHKAITGKFLLIDIQKEIPICKSLHYFYIVSFPFFSLCDCLKTRWEPFMPIAWFSFENATATNGGFTDLAPMSMRYLLRVSHRKYGSFNNLKKKTSGLVKNKLNPMCKNSPIFIFFIQIVLIFHMSNRLFFKMIERLGFQCRTRSGLCVAVGARSAVVEGFVFFILALASPNHQCPKALKTEMKSLVCTAIKA